MRKLVGFISKHSELKCFELGINLTFEEEAEKALYRYMACLCNVVEVEKFEDLADNIKTIDISGTADIEVLYLILKSERGYILLSTQGVCIEVVHIIDGLLTKCKIVGLTAIVSTLEDLVEEISMSGNIIETIPDKPREHIKVRLL